MLADKTTKGPWIIAKDFELRVNLYFVMAQWGATPVTELL